MQQQLLYYPWHNYILSRIIILHFCEERWPGGPEHYGGPGWRPVNIREVFRYFKLHFIFK